MISRRTRTERLSPERLSIRQALIAGLALMLLGALVLGAVLIVAEQRIEQAGEVLERQSRSAEAVEHGNLALLEARRYERDFLLRQGEFSLAEARSRYLSLFSLRMDDVDQALAEIHRSPEGPELRAEVDEIARLSRAYRAAFLNVAELVGLRGSLNSGLYGVMRRKGDEIERMLSLPGNEPLFGELLLLRRAKTDYILSGGLQHAVVFRKAAQLVAAHIGAARLSTQRRQQLLGDLGRFQGHFEEYVALSERINADVVRFRAAAAGIQPILDRVRHAMQQRRELVRQELLSTVQWAHRITMGVQALAVILAGLMAVFLYRTVATMIDKVEDFSARVGAGDLSARFETRATGEKARLARALNRMADGLRASHEAISRQAAELAATARMKAALLTSVSHEVKTPLNAIVGFAELLESGAAGALEPRQKEFAAQISASGKALAQLIDRIVEAARVDSGTAPQADAGAPRPEDAAHATAPSAAQVLVVDDNPVNLAVLERQVAALGYECEVAANGEEGLGKWKSGRFGLVVTDCNMPGMDGYELARRIRELESAEARERTPIIACTANLLAGEERKCLAAGMDDYIAKPVELRQLREKLSRWRPLPGPAGAPPATPLPAAPPPVDASVLAEVSGGDVALEREIIFQFLDVNDADAALLERAIEQRDAAQVVHAAHRMKGAGRTVGATDFAEVCAVLEAAGRAGDWSKVSGGVEPFRRELERLNCHLRPLVPAAVE